MGASCAEDVVMPRIDDELPLLGVLAFQNSTSRSSLVLLSGKTIYSAPAKCITVLYILSSCISFSGPLLLKHVQIREWLERADALRICADDLLVVEEHPGAAIVLRANVRDVVA
jgi:hypothetical protein